MIGTVDPDTGFVADLDEIDGALDAVVGPWAEADLNVAVPAVASEAIMPSTEALAGYVFHQLEPLIGGSCRLEQVSVFESDDLGADYPARVAPVAEADPDAGMDGGEDADPDADTDSALMSTTAEARRIER